MTGARSFVLAVARFWAGAVLLSATLSRSAAACDMCAVYQAVDLRESTTGVRLGVAQQYSHFSDLRLAGESTDNPHDERMDSSITQFLAAYQVRPDLGFQINLPFISRHFHRITPDGIENGDETGIGDAVISMRYRPLLHNFSGGNFRVALLAGVEVPSGDSDRLNEEPKPSQVIGPWRRGRPRHGGSDDQVSGIHGHDLSLGSGSLDAVFGGDASLLYGRWHVAGMVQYRLRSRGAYDYEYADELAASLAPGFFLWADDEKTLALRGMVMVETKGKDTVAGEVENDTAFTALYAGPSAQFTWRNHLNAEMAVDIPAIRNNSGLQIVPEYRLRLALSWLF